ncbi:MAG: GGDEF domain-containing protein [Gammaproteobacteria bacterium]|nr:GGDEF domain-containing protein [Gammaproteobacteria bacterium]
MYKNRSAREKILLGLSLAGAIFITPFAIFRILEQNWLMVSVDAVFIATMLYSFFYTYKTGKTSLSALILTIIPFSAIILAFYLTDAIQAYWFYPACIAVYYFLPARPALLTTLSFVIITIPKLYHEMEVMEFSIVIFSLIITNIFSYIFSISMVRQYDEIKAQARKDHLTDIANRRAFSEVMTRIHAAYQRNDTHYSLLMIDIDHFKKVNDAYGHDKGDQILYNLAQFIQSMIRVTDSFFRYGGEEFTLIFENTDLPTAKVLAEKIRNAVDNTVLLPDIHITISIGVAELQYAEPQTDWFNRADEALFRAKLEGRNRVCISENK